MRMNRIVLIVALAAAGGFAPTMLRPLPSAAVSLLMVDNFEGPGGLKNTLDNRTNVFIKAPSKVMTSVRGDTIEGKKTQVLMIRYEKRQAGGPFNGGGWAGYYTLLKSPEGEYLDASGYEALTFQVRGETGNENFVIGLSDQHWDQVGDAVKSQEIGKYLPAGKLNMQWQKATIPFDEFYVDYAKLSGISVVFDGALFPAAGAAGKIYIDDIALE